MLIVKCNLETKWLYIQVYSCVFFCGLLVVRYDQNAYEKVTSTLHGISSNETDVNMGDLRDSSYIIMAVTLVYSFLIQIVLFIGIYYEKTYLLIGVSVKNIQNWNAKLFLVWYINDTLDNDNCTDFKTIFNNVRF